ncbi:HCP-like protein [Linnemannia elongata AG-77]|uniref:HCP-like protein n=1 Tax=Linnemannia elongata AG-77 TaxID=1314771 RepID=A0A197JGH1_9FUNG|nr:HCP-like protein [Linnemannia elongata AG-77]
MTAQDTLQEHVQGFRSIHKSQPPSATSVPLNSPEVVHIGYYTDPDTNKDFIFWEDIQQAFDEAFLEPRRIAAIPDVVLDVVVGGESTGAEFASMERTVQDLSLKTPPQSSSSSARRSPAYGDVLQAMQNYNHMDVSESSSHLQEPQSAHDEHKDDSSDAPTEQGYQPETATKNLLDSQHYNSAANKSLMWTMINANQGNVHAQVALGDRYKDGRELHQDHDAAFDWYLKAADQNHPRAQYNIGLLFEEEYDGEEDDEEGDTEEGDDVVLTNHTKAFEWFLKSALQGYADAQAKVSQAYTDGTGVAKDNIKAMEWLVKAAENGHAESQYYMGTAYEQGNGVPQSDSESFEWYLKSADQGFAEAQAQVASAFEDRWVASCDNNKAIECYTKAIEWYTKAADQGLPAAQFALGRVHHLRLRGLPENGSEGMNWLIKAAVQGDTEALSLLRGIYCHSRPDHYHSFDLDLGTQSPEVRSEAVDWLIKAATQGHTEAQSMLREIYHLSTSDSLHDYTLDLETQSNIKEWFMNAAEQGVVHAQCCMAYMYSVGCGVDVDESKAFQWLLKAAEQGDEEAQTRVACWYQAGVGVTESREKAVECLEYLPTW